MKHFKPSQADQARIDEIREYWRIREKRDEADKLYRETRAGMTKAEKNTRPSIQQWENVHKIMLERERFDGAVLAAVQTVKAEQLPDEEIYAVLDRAARGKEASDYQNIQWAKNLLKIPLAEINPETVPSPAAVVILDWGRRNRDKFAEMMIPRAVAPKAEESDNEHSDGGKAMLDTIAEIASFGFESPSAPRPEGLPEESGLPAEDDRVGVS